MLLSVQDMVSLLRRSVNVQIPAIDEEGNEVTVTDSNYLSMTDNDLILYLKLGVSRAFPDVGDLEDLPDGSEYAVSLLAKIELYSALAVARADKVDMGVDNNTYLKQSQKFEHYMDLVASAKDQYDDWLNNEGAEVTGLNTVTTYDMLLDRKHFTNYYRERQTAPKVKIKIEEVTADSVSFGWSVTGMRHFKRYEVYVSNEPIVDIFQNGSSFEYKVAKNAQCIKSTRDFRNVFHSITGLSADTEYHLAVVSVEKNSVFGYHETTFTTMEEPEDKDDFSSGTFSPEEPDEPNDPDPDETGGEDVDG